MSGRVAFCAPGNRFGAALALCFRGEEVDEIRESRLIEGDRVWIVNEAELALWGEWKFPVTEKPWPLKQVRCPGCLVMTFAGMTADPSCHYSFCTIAYPPLPPLIAGLPHV